MEKKTMSEVQQSNTEYQWTDDGLPDSTHSKELMQRYAVSSVEYYQDAKDRIPAGLIAGVTFNLSCAVWGPLWAASRRLWLLCWCIAGLEVLALIKIGRAIWESPLGIEPEALAIGAALFCAERIAFGFYANHFFFQRFAKWRAHQYMQSGLSVGLAIWTFVLLGFMYGVMVYRFSFPDVAPIITKFPTDRRIALETARAIDALVDDMTVRFSVFFDGVTAVIRTILNSMKTLFIKMPWPVTGLLMLLAAWRAGGMKVALFTLGAILYLGIFGFWDKAMDTLSLVTGSVVICVVVGSPVGVWAAKNARVNAIVTPILDLMQTMPSFVYLIPAIAFFSVGRTPAVLATVVFAMPPMIRLTTLGIKQVPKNVRESALAFGATPAQLLFKVELPLALPSLMAGINQTVMMSLSMVVIAALIGAGGLGFEVYFALQQVEAGKGLLAGLAIVVCAMVIDRIIQSSRIQRKATG